MKITALGQKRVCAPFPMWALEADAYARISWAPLFLGISQWEAPSGDLELEERLGSLHPQLAVLELHLQQCQPQLLLTGPSFESLGSPGFHGTVSPVLGELTTPMAFSRPLLQKCFTNLIAPGLPHPHLWREPCPRPWREPCPHSWKGVPFTPSKGSTEPSEVSSLSFQTQEPRAQRPHKETKEASLVGLRGDEGGASTPFLGAPSPAETKPSRPHLAHTPRLAHTPQRRDMKVSLSSGKSTVPPCCWSR